jgi:HAD superfamily hydrolase (TIGR01509 family)
MTYCRWTLKKQKMGFPTLVIFDCDGVLVDSEPIANAVFAEHLGKLGIHLTIEQALTRFLGRSMKSCMEDVTKELHSKKLPVPLNFPSAFLEAMQEDTFAQLANSVQAVAHIVDVIDALEEKGIAFCVASSGEHAKMAVTLGKTLLAQRFGNRIYSATQVERGKPAPDLFIFAATQMGVDPSKCVVIEDSPAGVQAAVSAGMTAMAYCALTPEDAIRRAENVDGAIADGQVRFFYSMKELVPFLEVFDS